ncbi:MAG: hypothetical protein EBT34_06260 [Acetobacteraceae bacterium]|nr:hypothetical protein [Acetobacteraceae bacterium]
MDDQQGSIEPLIMRLKAEIKKRQWDAVDDAEAVHALVLEMSSRVGISHAAAAHIAAQFAPFGPMQKFLDDESIEEVWVNGDDRVFISRDGQSELTSEVMTQSELVGIIDRMLRRTTGAAPGCPPGLVRSKRGRSVKLQGFAQKIGWDWACLAVRGVPDFVLNCG